MVDVKNGILVKDDRKITLTQLHDIIDMWVDSRTNVNEQAKIKEIEAEGYNPENAPYPVNFSFQSRMQRLQKFLIGMGHVVHTAYDDKLDIKCFHVTVS